MKRFLQTLSLALALALALAGAGGVDAASNPAPEQLVQIGAALQAAAEPGKGRLLLSVRIGEGCAAGRDEASWKALLATT